MLLETEFRVSSTNLTAFFEVCFSCCNSRISEFGGGLSSALIGWWDGGSETDALADVTVAA
jgi:hypothetical protein